MKMTQKDRLIELLHDWGTKNTDGINVDSVAKHLLENNVMAPPCKIGDTVYVYNLDVCDWVMSPKVLTFVLCQSGWFVTLDMGSTDKHPDGEVWCVKLSDFGKTIFPTREEAEKALKDGAE